MSYSYKTAIGQDSHRFVNPETENNQGRILTLGGVILPGFPALAGNSDADVVLHALTNAISGISGVNILGEIADKLCLENGISDSKVYLAKAIESLGDWRIFHISISIEAKKPHLSVWIPVIKQSLAALTDLKTESIGLTATSGEGLTDFGRGLGIQAFCVITVRKQE